MEPLAGIAAFARVVEAGSFSEAARRLRVSKSVVSAQVQRLEERLGVRLLQRTTRRVAATEAGLAYYRRCARILAEAEAGEQEALALHREPRGTLRISAPDTFGWMHIAPALKDFLAGNPGLSVELSLSAAHVDLVGQGLDLAIRIGRLPADSPVVVRRLADSPLIVCAAPSYLAGRPAPERPADLARHDCLVFSPLGWGGKWGFVAESGVGWVTVSGSLATDSGEVLREAALAGLGIALLPAWAVADALADGALVRLLPRHPLPSSTVYAVYPSNRMMSAKVRAFVTFLARRFGRNPDWRTAHRPPGRH
ncbi:MAG: LysR family transcriptional regulator [Rhodospirillales bacterium]